MSEAPERIWVDPSNGSSDGKWFLAGEWPRLGKQDIEYFRGDRIKELEKRLAIRYEEVLHLDAEVERLKQAIQYCSGSCHNALEKNDE